MIRKAFFWLTAGVVLVQLQVVSFAQPLFTAQAMLDAARAKEAKGNHREAIQGYQAVLKRFPSGEYHAVAVQQIAMIQAAELKDLYTAAGTYGEIVSQYPNENPSITYSAATQLITLAGQLNKPELSFAAYKAMLSVCKGSSNRSGMHAGLISYYISQKNESLIRQQIEEMFRECRREPNFRGNVEAVIGQLMSSPELKPLGEEVRKRLDSLPTDADPDAAASKEYQDLVAAKDYAAAIAKAEALAKTSPQGYYTPSVLQNAQSLAENQLKDMNKARDLCRLWALSMRGEDEGNNLAAALSAWVRACSTLKDAAGAREAAEYALAKFPNCTATDDVLLTAAKVKG
ncbi:MAG: tetratricopeptide repeat protein, partial [Armatimonadetes bacterium]|nr:tetratricopeptide repeat protein [Armatimonadota bacterium]